MALAHQLGGHNRGPADGDEVRERRTRGQLRKIPEGLLSTFNESKCRNIVHALVGTQLEWRVASIHLIQSSKFKPDPQSYDDVVMPQYKDV